MARLVPGARRPAIKRLTTSGVYLSERFAWRPEVLSCNGCALGPGHRSLSNAACRGQEHSTRQGFFSGTQWLDLRPYAQPPNMHRTGNSRIKFWISGQDFDQPSQWAGHSKLAPNLGPRSRPSNATRCLSTLRDWSRWSSRRARYVCEIAARMRVSAPHGVQGGMQPYVQATVHCCLCKFAYLRDFPKPGHVVVRQTHANGLTA